MINFPGKIMTTNKNELTIGKMSGTLYAAQSGIPYLGCTFKGLFKRVAERVAERVIENDPVEPCKSGYIDDDDETPWYLKYDDEPDFNQLKKIFCIPYFENSLLEPILMPILAKLYQGIEIITIPEIDWLIQHHIYIVAAKAYYARYQKNDDLWELTKACRYYREGGLPQKGIDITEFIDMIDVNTANYEVLAALSTTRGGAYKDLSELSKAFDCVNRAIYYNQYSFRAYNLKGALHFKIREYEQGYDCFLKAQELGALEAIVNKNLTSIVKFSSLHQQEIAQFLFNKDPQRFNWALDYLKNNNGGFNYPV